MSSFKTCYLQANSLAIYQRLCVFEADLVLGFGFHLLGTFVRSFQLPSNIDADKATANLTDGVLTLRLPKKDVVKGRKIEVNASH